MGHLIGIDIRGLSHNLFIESLAAFAFSIIAAKLAELGLRAVATRLGQLSIVVDSPYRIGDCIRLSDAERGCVSRIGLRSTRICLSCIGILAEFIG